MEELLRAVRQACSPTTWSRAVELTRRFAVSGVSSSDEEIVCRVKLPDRAVPVTVQLYPEDEEWDCDCQTRAPCCEHVAAAVIAVRKARAEGKELPAGKSSSGKLIYRLSRHQGELSLQRIVVRNDGSEFPLKISLASALARHAAGVDLSPSQEDLNVDRLLGQGSSGPLHRDRVTEVVKLLASARNVEFEGQPVHIATEVLKPHAVVRDANGGFEVSIEQDPRITQVIASGVALAGDQIHRLGGTDAAGLRYEKLPSRKVYERAEVSTLVTEVLPELQRRFHVDVQTTNLPEVTSEERPRVVLEVEQVGDTLSALPLLVYGDPPIARVDKNRLVHLEGPIPIRNVQWEQRAAEQARHALGLMPGARVFLRGSEATAFAQKLDQWHGEVKGTQGKRFIHDIAVEPRIDPAAPGFGIRFEAQPGEGERLETDADTVLRAWQVGESLVPLLGGGWARLPEAWLQEHGDRLALLLAARQSNGEPAPHAAPAVIGLCEALDTPPPQRFEPMRALLQGLSHLPAAELPRDLRAELRPYQQQGINWLHLLKTLGLGATLADDMGLGKTLQTLCVVPPRTLIVCPTSVVHNWASEIEKFRPDLSFSVYHGRDRKLDLEQAVTLTSYSLLRLDQEQLSAVEWNMIVLDEAQVIKNPESQVSQAAFTLRGKFRVTLSGTPVENRLEELWSQLHFTNPGLLGGRSDFQERFSEPIREGRPGAAQLLRSRIAPFLLRRDKRSVAPELPPRSDIVLHCELEAEERQLYQTLHAATQREVVERLQAGGGVMQALEALLRLRQAACHPALVPGQVAERSSKVEQLLFALERATAEDHKALVFSQWTSFLDLIEPELQRTGHRFCRLDGSTRDRQAVVEEFQSEEGPKVMLLSLKAGGTGLNLTAADHVFLLDLWWNPAVEQQAADRAHRIGQERPVFVYRLVAKDTVEERILKLQARKQALADAALADASQASSLTREDLLELLQ